MVTFTHCNNQVSELSIRAQKVVNTILKYASLPGSNNIPVAIKLYKAKIPSLLLYDAQLCVSKNVSTLEAAQSKFLRIVWLELG